MVSSSIMTASSSPDKCRASTSSAFHDELEIEWSMRNAAIIDHQNEPDQNLSGRVLNAFCPFDAATHTDMIHIEVPDSKTLVEKFDGVSKYVGYNLHINGWYHSCVRYSSLYEFSEMIKQKFANKYKGPEFPAKKLFKLDSRAIDDRRTRISKYFQALVQHPEIARYYLVEKKLLGFQVDSFRATSNFVSIDVFKGDGEKLQIKCNVSDSTGEVMKIIAEKLGFKSPEQFLWNYGLFMARSRDTATASYSVSSESFDPLIVRLFRNFEAPFISLSTSNQKSIADGVFHFICLRKLVWDPRTEEPLMDEPIFLDLLYRQAVQDFKNGHLTEIKDEQLSRLKSHMQKEEKSMFLRTCHQIPSYSYEILENCSGEFPRNVHECSIKFGRRQIILSFKDDAGHEQHRIFRATRIRVWRISQIVDDVSFQFEYLMARDTFEWITLHTSQAILMSLLLQSIGAEILYEHNNLTIEQQILKERQSKGMYVEKDETPVLVRDPKKPIIILKNAVEPSDPLGVMEHYRTHTHMLTTISESIPQKNEAFANVSNEDL